MDTRAYYAQYRHRTCKLKITIECSNRLNYDAAEIVYYANDTTLIAV